MLTRECIMKKVEPWNSVRVTFSISKEAANKLKQLAQQKNDQLKYLGITSLQVEGEDIVRLSISNSEGNIQNVIARHQPVQLAASSSALPHNLSEVTHAGDGPHEFDTILSQLTAGELQPGTSGYTASADHNVFVVPHPHPTVRKRSSRKSKDKGSAKSSGNGTCGIISVASNGPASSVSSNSNTQGILTSRMETPSEQTTTDSLGELGEHLDINDLIGADGSLDHLEIGGKHYAPSVDEMVTDIFRMDGMGTQPNSSLTLSPSSLNSNRVQPQMEGMNNVSQPPANTSDHNTNEVDELLNHLHSIEAEDEQSTSHLNPSIGDLPYNQDNFPNVSGHSPVSSHIIQRQMSYPQYSSKQGSMHAPNSQGMFTSVSGRQSVGPISTGLASPHQHLMQNSGTSGDPGGQMPGMIPHGNQKGNMVAHQPEITGKMLIGAQTIDKDIGQGFPGFNQVMGPRNPRPPGASMMQQPVGNNWKIPPGATMPQHTQHNCVNSPMHHSSGMTSPRPNMNINSMQSAPGFNQALTPTKRGYPGPVTVPHFPSQPSGLPDGNKCQGMATASPLLVNLLQTSSSTSTTGVSSIAGQAPSSHVSGTVGEPPKPKRKKPQRRKKPSKNSYTPTTPDAAMMTGPGMMPGPGMAGSMPPHMSPQHTGGRMQQPQFSAQYGMQQVNSPGQYLQPHSQSPLPQMHSMPDNQKYGHFPNGTNMSSPGLHPMGNKASPSHVFSPEQKTAYIETINRSDVGSRLSSGTPTQMGQPRIPTPGHSPSGHGHITPNHMPSSSVAHNMFMGNVSGTVHHGPRVPGMNGMQHPQMQNRVQMSSRMAQQGMQGLHSGPNLRVGGPSPVMQNSPMMNQQFSMQGQLQFQQTNPQFQSPPPNMHAGVVTMYNQGGLKPKQPTMMASPSPMSTEYMQETPPPNVVINGSDSFQQALPSQRQMPGYQKQMFCAGGDIMMQSEGNVRSPANYFHQQANNSPGHVMMRTQNNPSMYHNPATQIPVAGPNNFNNSNNLEPNQTNNMPSNKNILPVLAPLTSGCVPHCSTSDGANISEATVTHYPMSSRPKLGVLDSGEISVLLKGTCSSPAQPPPGPLISEVTPNKLARLSKKSPGSVTDGHSSSPGSSHSHTPSPAGVKRSVSTSNPPTPLHIDPMGSPTSMTMQSHSSSRSTTPRTKSGRTTPRSRSGTPVAAASGSNRRVSVDRQGTFPGSQQRVHQGAQTPTPATFNGPGVLNRPGSGTESNQHYMTLPSTPGQSRYSFQNLSAYQNVPGAPSPMTSNQDLGHPPMGHTPSGYGYAPPSYPKDNNFHAQQHLHQQVVDANTLKTHEMPPKSPRGHSVPNHHPSQMNSPLHFEEANLSQLAHNQPQQQTMSNVLLSHSVSNHKQDTRKDISQNCLNSASVSPHSTESSTSPHTAVTDSNQTPGHAENSPHFFNSQTQDLLANSKTKKQQENPSAPTLPLQS